MAAETEALARAAAIALDDKKAQDVVVLDVHELLVITDIFVIASGGSRRQVQALIDAVEDSLRGIDRKPLRREGEEDAQWVLLDYGDVVVHVFDHPTRAYYDLERLWGDAPRLDAGLDQPAVSEG
ncbi:MAG: ribosome silencing factor [Acidimicrobiia bacterium]|nr:ribosome silencing factor [Acidimicrobiia bacterium]MBT8217057.1 ribosome silencing factor [Acidimicrobiia bacterium]NNF11515.1 ribosome silencing factor [Acidimicrobiia bacterium]NNL71055.1 ribosome silencing factor [Acidimicrobiia bacterium]